MTANLLFIGENRSRTAQRRGWRWQDGRLAARPLFQALAAVDVDPAVQEFRNLWTDSEIPAISRTTLARIRAHQARGGRVVALGKRVAGELARRGVDHLALVHPAARGVIRLRLNYIAHVVGILGPVVAR